MSAKGSRFKGSQLHSQTIAQGKVPVGFMVTRGAKSKRGQPLHTGNTEVFGNVICHPNGHTYGQWPTSQRPPTACFYRFLKYLDMGAPCCGAFVTRRTDMKENAALVSRTRLLFLALEAGPACLLSQCNRAILEPCQAKSVLGQKPWFHCKDYVAISPLTSLRSNLRRSSWPKKGETGKACKTYLKKDDIEAYMLRKRTGKFLLGLGETRKEFSQPRKGFVNSSIRTVKSHFSHSMHLDCVLQLGNMLKRSWRTRGCSSPLTHLQLWKMHSRAMHMSRKLRQQRRTTAHSAIWL
jgi:hypothetical protein